MTLVIFFVALLQEMRRVYTTHKKTLSKTQSIVSLIAILIGAELLANLIYAITSGITGTAVIIALFLPVYYALLFYTVHLLVAHWYLRLSWTQARSIGLGLSIRFLVIFVIIMLVSSLIGVVMSLLG